ncbi:hypothetical protein PHAVU_009G214000 [Phaseolus vulgaris]|uniref:F-box domain-containing protein n=1 Tax=Phaseolus vulgaris TaxID=3885 RepID=V7AYV6_PHAVU|nr:hypothetical protein PHAVU_009G214000g [Phaseolus vulgaris]ESW10490.1 hypothetical protein PHAVU_009G214000g [Phaseolus vulgaris]
MEKKRRRRSGERNEEDRLSDLPNGVLLHIMEYLPTRQVFQNSVLSKRWKNLWKSLTTLSLKPFKGIRKYNKFISLVLSNRDHSVPLHNLDLTVFVSVEPKLLNNFIKYGALHHLQKLTLSIDSKFKEIPNYFVPLIFNCQSLTFLDLFICSSRSSLKLPPSLLLPSLKTLHLSNVTFTARDNDCVEPFSTCILLTTLVLRYSMHQQSAQTLYISSPSLSTLKLENLVHSHTLIPKIVLYVPNMSSFALENSPTSMCYELSCTCHLPFLEEVKIDNSVHIHSSIIINWLGLFSNVRTLTLSSHTLYILLKDLCMGKMDIQPPYFARLESFNIKMGFNSNMMSGDEVKMVLEYLVQNCKTTIVNVIVSS